MWGILIAFVAFIVVLLLIMRGLIWWTTKVIKVYIESKNRAAEEIVNSGRPPEDWLGKSLGKIKSLKANPGGMARARRLEKRVKKESIKRVSKLIDYFKTATLVQDEDTREMLMAELKAARDSWENKSLDEIMAAEKTQSDILLSEEK